MVEVITMKLVILWRFRAGSWDVSALLMSRSNGTLKGYRLRTMRYKKQVPDASVDVAGFPGLEATVDGFLRITIQTWMFHHTNLGNPLGTTTVGLPCFSIRGWNTEEKPRDLKVLTTSPFFGGQAGLQVDLQ